jgi:hypothetical protein
VDEAAKDRTRLCGAEQRFVMPAGGVRREGVVVGLRSDFRCTAPVCF